MRKKILFIITQSNFGGAQKYVFDLATGLDKESFDVAVAAGGNGELFRRLENAGIKTVSLRWMKREAINPITDTIGLWEIYKLIKNERPDAVHLNSSKAGFSGSLAARFARFYSLPARQSLSVGGSEPRSAGRVEGSPTAFDSFAMRTPSGNKIRVIYTVHGAVFEAAFSWPVRKLFLLLEKFTARFKDKIICVSEADRLQWLRHKVAPKEKLVTIHNGINLNIDFATKEEARKKLFAKYSSPLFSKEGLGEIYLVGSIGYFYPEKNYAALIKAAKLIKTLPPAQQKRNVVFLINGDGQQRHLLESLIKDCGLQKTFFLPGAIWPGSKFLKAFDVFVLPSTKEGFPYAILEAMAAGVPIVASDVGGIPEMIKNGQNGFLVKPNDHEALAEKILQILENPSLAQKFSASALQKVKEFSLEKMISQTVQQY